MMHSEMDTPTRMTPPTAARMMIYMGRPRPEVAVEGAGSSVLVRGGSGEGHGHDII